MSTAKSLSTVTALWLASALCLLSGCASTTSPVKPPVSCPPPPTPDARLMEAPQAFVALPEDGSTDVTALPQVTKNNQYCALTRARYVELQQWIRGRAQ